MRNLLALVGFAVVAFFGIGWYQGWYSVSRTQTTPGESDYSIKVHEKKIGQDVQKSGKVVGEKVSDFFDKKPGGSEIK